MRRIFYLLLFSLFTTLSIARGIPVIIQIHNQTDVQPEYLYVVELERSFPVPDTARFQIDLPRRGIYTFILKTDTAQTLLPMAVQKITRKDNTVKLHITYKDRFMLIGYGGFGCFGQACRRFIKRYDVGFYALGCMVPDIQEALTNNRRIAKKLTEQHGTAWREMLPVEVPGVE